MIAVLDTNVLIAAQRSRHGASNAILLDALRYRFQWLVSVPLFFEYEDALTRAELLLEIERTRASMRKFINDLSPVIVPVELHYLWRPQLRDPKDEMVVDTAANGQANALVTHNLKDFEPIRGRFDFEVLSPSAFLKRIRR